MCTRYYQSIQERHLIQMGGGGGGGSVGNHRRIPTGILFKNWKIYPKLVTLVISRKYDFITVSIISAVFCSEHVLYLNEMVCTLSSYLA